MGRAATVYAEELFTYGYGHPLWCPEPSKGLDGSTRDVQLGDVGYVDEDGGFRRLFNVTVDAGHKLNAGGVPEGFLPVDLNESLISVRNKFLHPLPICSESVEGRTVRAQVAANASGVAGGEVSYAFRCASHRGAFLFLKDHATKSSIDPNPQLEQYMLQHHESWYAFATDPKKLGIRCDRERIVLVRGTIKTSAWAIGAFLGKVDRAYEVTVGARLGPNGSANLELSSEFTHYNSCVQRSGPDRTSPQATPMMTDSSVPHEVAEPNSTTTNSSGYSDPFLDQCVFVSYYKIKSRLLFPKKIVANAEPYPEDGDFGAHDDTSSALYTMEANIEPETVHVEPHSPLDEILDYILQHSDATVAIASDADIEWLFPGNEIPSALADTLRDLAPQIIVDETKAGQLDTYRGLSQQRLPISQSAAAEHSSLPSLLAYSLVPRGTRGKLSTVSDSMASEFQSEWGNTHTSESSSLRTLSTVSSPTPIPKIVDAMWSNTSPSRDTVIITPKPHISSPGPSSETMEDIESMGSLYHYHSTDKFAVLQSNLCSSGAPTAPFDLPAQDLTSHQPTVQELASQFPSERQIVPQLTYRPTTQSDRRRYIQGVILEHPIMFYNRTCTSCGISLGDALRGLTNDMYGREDSMFENGGPSIAVRLMWPGYAPWSRQIATRDFYSPPRPITRAKLVKNIAKTVKRFIEDQDGKPMDKGADARYKVGRRHIGVEDLELLGLQHVSMGSWQAHLRLRRAV